MAIPTFFWGEYEATHFIVLLNTTYKKVIHWRLNLFKIPYGSAGKAFTQELGWLFKAFAESSALESISALKAATIMPVLFLQKPSKSSNAKDHTKCLQRCLTTWRDGNLPELMCEGRTIQQRIPKNTGHIKEDTLSRQFANNMSQGKTKAALRLPAEENRSGYLHLEDLIETGEGSRKVRDLLLDKHPPSQPRRNS